PQIFMAGYNPDSIQRKISKLVFPIWNVVRKTDLLCGYLCTKGGMQMGDRILGFKRAALAIALLCLLVFSTSCTARKMKDYYSQKSNYVNATGIVTHISYNEDRSALYLGFSDLNPQFD